MISALEEVITDCRDCEGCMEIIKAYSKLFDGYDREKNR